MTVSPARRTERINPDSMATLWLTVGLVGFLAVASFMVSFTGLHEVAAWAGLPLWLRWAVPVFIDVAILAYTLAVLIHRHRGEKTWASWLSLAGFTLFSMIANGAHALSIPHPNEVQQVIGAAIASMAPVAVFAATEQLGRLVIREREDPTASTREQPASGRATKEERSEESRGPEVHAGMGLGSPSTAGQDPAVSGEAVTEVPDSERPPVLAQNRAPENPARGEEATEERTTTAPSNESRPQLSLVGHKPVAGDLEGWVKGLVSAGSSPTGREAAEFLGVAERTGRSRLNALKREKPGLFEPSRKEGTNA